MEALSTVKAIVEKAIEVYQDFMALQEECEAFMEILFAVSDLLGSIEKQYKRGDYGSQNTSLSRPLGMLEEGIKSGEKVLHKCAKKRSGIQKVKPVLLSKDYLGRLAAAKSKIFEAMDLLKSCGIDIQGKILRDIKGVNRAIDDLNDRIVAFKHDVADAVRGEIQKGGDDVVNRIIAELHKHHIQVDRQQLLKEMKDIQEEKSELFKSKLIFDRQLIDGIVALSLKEQNAANHSLAPQTSLESTGTSGSDSSQLVEGYLECGIMRTRVQDPVILVEDGRIYDRQYLCRWLLQQHSKSPMGIDYDLPLRYIDAIHIRNMLTNIHGDAAYVKYDDSKFLSEYTQIWKMKTNESSSPNVALPDHKEEIYREVECLWFGMNKEMINIAKAEVLLESLGNDPVGLAMLAYSHEDIRGFKRNAESSKNWRIAIPYLQQNSGHNARCAILLGAVNHLGHDDCPKDYRKAKEYYELAANQGSADAQNSLGVLYHDGLGVPQDYRNAKEYYKLAANQGHAFAQRHLGVLYEQGLGVTQDYGKAMEYYELAANQGNANAQHSLGIYYEQGLGVSQDYGKAREYFELAANQGNTDAQNYLGVLFQLGRGVPQSYGTAIEYFDLAANQGHADAQNHLGLLYQQGLGLPQHYGKAREYYELAANQGNANAQFNLGVLYHDCLGVPQDYGKAKEFYELAANQGNADAQNYLGVLYQEALGVPQDYGKARELYELAANQGHAGAQNYLGLLYHSGLGVPCDYHKAREYYELAANQNNAFAQNFLGVLYEQSLGVPRDYKKAKEYFELAAHQCHALAQLNLGGLYQQGLGVPQDFTKAREYYELAASQGIAYAQFNLGGLYQQGLGVPQDYCKAREYYELAANQGHALAQRSLGALYMNGLGGPLDFRKATEYLQLAANQRI
jgi:TPR repeat protein